MIRTFLRATVPAALVTLAVACGGTPPPASNAGPSATTAPAAESDSAPTAAPEAETDSAPTAAPEADTAGDTTSIGDISASLDGLKSYRMRFSFSFDGKDEQGKSQKGSVEILQEINRETNDQHLRFSTTGDASGESSNGGAFEMYRVKDASYMFSGQGEQKCVGFTGGQDQPGQDAAIFKPGDIVGGVNNARLVAKGETVNGVRADHYRFDQGGLSFGAFAKAGGDAWLAQDGGYVVKYTGTATGKDGLFGKATAEGTFTWEYNVDSVNALEAITLPKECEGQTPATDIPLPPNATDKAGFGAMQTFKTTDAPADVAAFYKKEMPAQGWTAGEESNMGEELTTLQFSKDSRKLSITITKDESGSSVLINEEKSS